MRRGSSDVDGNHTPDRGSPAKMAGLVQENKYDDENDPKDDSYDH